MRNMRLLIDANIILDVLQERQPHVADASVIWKLCETDQAEGVVSSLTVADLIYVMRKELDEDQIADVIEKLRLIFVISDFTAADLFKAAEMKWADFEDAVQSAIAERVQADYIITRNVRDFIKSKVMAFAPSEYIAWM